MLKGLAHEHPIKWISMEQGELAKMSYACFIEWQAFDLMVPALLRDVGIRWLGQGQLAYLMFDQDLPERDNAEINSVGRIADYRDETGW